MGNSSTERITGTFQKANKIKILQTLYIIVLIKVEISNRASEAPKSVEFQIDRSQPILVENISEEVRLKALDPYFAFL